MSILTKVRLWFRSTSNDTQLPRYMTLSHCWGQASFLTLTKSTLQQLSEGILITSLPQTFQDAIWVAYKLGARYLWIDSLCILQDSISDWQREASLMADVYRGSLCNIAATRSADASTSCFQEREEPLVQPCIVKTAWDDRDNGEYRVRAQNFWSSAFEGDPLRHRGWIVQELLLAPRILHISKQQIFWECYEVIACEEYSSEVSNAPYSSEGVAGSPNFRKTHLSKTALNLMERAGLGASWSDIVTDYTSCELTKPEDKLIALSGVAMVLQTTFQDNYLAGLWQTDLARQLLWVPTYGQSLVPAQGYRAPSWSWASVDGAIYVPLSWEDHEDEEVVLIEIWEAYTLSVGNNPYGKITGGLIRLSRQLTTIKLRPSFKSQLGFQYRLRGKAFIPRIWEENDDISVSSLAPPRHIHCLPIREEVDECRHAESFYECLLLIPTHIKNGQFYRWGTIGLPVSDFECSEPHEWLEYEEFDNGNTYTISIV